MAQTELQEKQGNAPEYSGNYDVVGQEMEKHRKRRKRRKRGSETVEDVEEENRGGKAEGFLLRDPLEVFGRDIMLMILSNLDARSVALSLLVSRTWHGVASSDRIWGPKVDALSALSRLKLGFWCIFWFFWCGVILLLLALFFIGSVLCLFLI